MISQTATVEEQVGSRQGKWVQWAGWLTRLLITLGILALLGALLAAALPRLWGYQSFVIYGNSMEPTIKLGSLILAEPANVDDLQVGDIIVFGNPSNGVTVTHRIVGVREEDGQRFFQTKGDASNGGDPTEVSLEGGVHRLAYKLPYLGYFVDFANSTLGIILLLVLPAIGLLAMHWSKHRRSQGEAEEEDGQRFFQTKGDASNGGDPTEVSLEGGVHRLAYKLPYLGYFVDFAKSTLGIILLIALPVAGLLALQLTNGRKPAGEA